MSAVLAIPAGSFSPSPPNGAGGMLHIPVSAHTLAGFRDWAETLPEKTKITFLRGAVFVDVSKEDIETHVKVKGELFAVLYQLAREIDFGRIFQDGILLTNTAANLSTNPDAVGARWRTLKTKKARAVMRDGKCLELEGTPDWVLEVVSPSSVVKDGRDLKAAYHAAGIPEYWLVDARGEDVAFTIFGRRKSGYLARELSHGWQFSKVFARFFRLSRTRDQLGMWDYTLGIRHQV
jgi:Uma2 family endonuclease